MMRRLLVCGWLLVAGTAWNADSNAVEVSGLYEAEVRVASKRASQRDAALGQALLKVVVKVSGERNPGGNPVIEDAARAPGRFVQQFRYRTTPAPGGAGGQQGEPVLSLWTRFDPQLVDGTIRDAGLAVWGRVRPAVLVWLAVEQGGRREFVGTEDVSVVTGALRAAAAERGVPVVLPLLDLEDRSRVRVQDVWAGFQEPVRAASARYQTEVVVMARLYRRLPTVWEGRWDLMLGDGVYQWTNQGERIERLVLDGMHEVADRLATRFARLTGIGDSAGVGVIVSGVRNLDDYARTLRYLDSLDEVTRVDVIEVEPERIAFVVSARGGSDGLRQVIALGSTLTVEPFSTPGGSLQVRLLP